MEAETHGANEKQKEVEGLPQMHEETEDEVAELMRRLTNAHANCKKFYLSEASVFACPKVCTLSFRIAHPNINVFRLFFT